ncbi:hypothetical protein EVAR_18084_1 [Eumeta japonica]|uniref:Uncharacterized protein n=1 Tax=Eumeta variegata TaxID=151549 RepID=A0A4C1VKF2_EUMVA|nr:hypothetical protein EVAR_18084_1 [Eumeta japonica]
MAPVSRPDRPRRRAPGDTSYQKTYPLQAFYRRSSRFVVERQIRGSAVGCMLHVNTCCRQASTMDFRELTPHTIQGCRPFKHENGRGASCGNGDGQAVVRRGKRIIMLFPFKDVTFELSTRLAAIGRRPANGGAASSGPGRGQRRRLLRKHACFCYGESRPALLRAYPSGCGERERDETRGREPGLTRCRTRRDAPVRDWLI